MSGVNKRVYTGLCVGGPMAKMVLNSVGDRKYPVAKMEAPITSSANENDRIEYVETRRGLYEYSYGIWWWRGWEREGKR